MEMNYCPRFKDAVIVDEYMWFFDDEIQCVCKMKLVSSRITIVYRHDFTYRLLPQKVAYKAGVVYFINPNMLEILVYDIEKNTGRLITGENTEKCEKQYSAAYAIVQKDGVYIVPFFCSKELRYFEFSTNKIIIDYCFINELKKEIGNNERALQFPIIFENNIWAPIPDKAKLLKYDLATRSMTIVKNDRIEKAIQNVCIDKENVWLTERDSSDIICITKEIVKRIPVEGKQSYSFLCNIENYIMALPRYGSAIVLVDKKTEAVFICNLIEEISSVIGGASKVLNYAEDNQNIFLFSNLSDDIWKINLDSKEVTFVKGIYDATYREIVELIKWEKRKSITENKDCSLNELINIMDLLEHNAKKTNIGVGSTILKHCIGEK